MSTDNARLFLTWGTYKELSRVSIHIRGVLFRYVELQWKSGIDPFRIFDLERILWNILYCTAHEPCHPCPSEVPE
jgi:hypothetical protein